MNAGEQTGAEGVTENRPGSWATLALFDAVRPTTLNQDLGPELKTADWKTEAGVLAALNAG